MQHRASWPNKWRIGWKFCYSSVKLNMKSKGESDIMKMQYTVNWKVCFAPSQIKRVIRKDKNATVQHTGDHLFWMTHLKLLELNFEVQRRGTNGKNHTSLTLAVIELLIATDLVLNETFEQPNICSFSRSFNLFDSRHKKFETFCKIESN